MLSRLRFPSFSPAVNDADKDPQDGVLRNRDQYDIIGTKDVAAGTVIDLDWPSLDYDRSSTN